MGISAVRREPVVLVWVDQVEAVCGGVGDEEGWKETRTSRGLRCEGAQSNSCPTAVRRLSRDVRSPQPTRPLDKVFPAVEPGAVTRAVVGSRRAETPVPGYLAVWDVANAVIPSRSCNIEVCSNRLAAVIGINHSIKTNVSTFAHGST